MPPHTHRVFGSTVKLLQIDEDFPTAIRVICEPTRAAGERCKQLRVRLLRSELPAGDSEGRRKVRVERAVLFDQSHRGGDLRRRKCLVRIAVPHARHPLGGFPHRRPGQQGPRGSGGTAGSSSAASCCGRWLPSLHRLPGPAEHLRDSRRPPSGVEPAPGVAGTGRVALLKRRQASHEEPPLRKRAAAADAAQPINGGVEMATRNQFERLADEPCLGLQVCRERAANRRVEDGHVFGGLALGSLRPQLEEGGLRSRRHPRRLRISQPLGLSPRLLRLAFLLLRVLAITHRVVAPPWPQTIPAAALNREAPGSAWRRLTRTGQRPQT